MAASDTPPVPLPRPVWWIRTLMFTSAGLFALFMVVGLAQTGISAYEVSYFLVATLPGLAQLVLALLIRRHPRAIFWNVLVLHVLFVVVILVLVLGGSEDGRVTQLIIPAAILVLLRHADSRAFFTADR